MSALVVNSLGLLRYTLAKFAAVGVLNTLLTASIIFFLKSAFGMADIAANACGYAAGLACSFVLNRQWTFRHADRLLPALARFACVFAAAYGVNLAAVMGLIGAGLNDYLSHLAGMPLYSAVFYLGCRRFAFPARTGSTAVQALATARPVASTNVSAGVTFEPFRLRHSALGWLVLTMTVAAAALFYRLGALPLEVWDEARLANNALEMSRTGLSLVTTYEGLPDHWNTKPPMLIWLMAISIQLLGATEWAVRLPSALAALATAAVIFAFCSWHLRKPMLGFLAIAALFGAPGYVAFHAARSGDYDALLTLWTTSYLLAGYLYLYGRPDRRHIWLAACTACIALAFMTKTVQGLIFLPALFIHAAWHRRLVETIRTPSFYLNVLVTLAVCIGYYAAREQIDPGYFASVLDNDLLGRFATAIENHRGGPLYYVLNVKAFPWLVPGLLLAGWLAWRSSGETRRLAGYLGLASVVYLLVISTAGTKLTWYAVPLYPPVALIVALGVMAVVEHSLPRIARSGKAVRATCSAGAVAVGLVVVLVNVAFVEYRLAKVTSDQNERYGLLLRGDALRTAGVREVVVAYPGHQSAHSNYYIAPVKFYLDALGASGIRIQVQAPSAALPEDIRHVAACGTIADDLLAAHPGSRVVASDVGCRLLELERAE